MATGLFALVLFTLADAILTLSFMECFFIGYSTVFAIWFVFGFLNTGNIVLCLFVLITSTTFSIRHKEKNDRMDFLQAWKKQAAWEEEKFKIMRKNADLKKKLMLSEDQLGGE